MLSWKKPAKAQVGEMAEWLKAHAWKACLGETLTWVRIPLSPPFSNRCFTGNWPSWRAISVNPGDGPYIGVNTGRRWEIPMSEEKRELLEKLKFELAFVEDGGYGRSVRTPHKPTSPFQDSMTCLNFGDPLRAHPCAECVLMRYVPESRKGEDVPCHHIPLDQR